MQKNGFIALIRDTVVLFVKKKIIIIIIMFKLWRQCGFIGGWQD